MVLNKENATPALALLLSLTAYYLLQDNYNIFYADDTWTISNAWNYVNLGVAKDLVFIEPDATGFAQYFGLTYSFIIGHLLNFVGWSKSGISLVNTSFVLLTATTWWYILKALPFSKSVRQMTVLFLPLMPPFFFAAHSGRADALAVLLVSVQFLAFINKRYFIAALLTGVAMETHIMGAVGGFYMLAYAIYNKKELLSNRKDMLKMAGLLAAGFAASGAYYMALHWDMFSLQELEAIVQGKRDMSTPVNNYILSYFVNFDWQRHLWELALLGVATTLYIKKGIFRQNRFLLIFLAVLIISTIITRRENRNYFVYIFPAFLLAYFFIFEQMGKLRPFAQVLTASLAIYFGAIYLTNRDYQFDELSHQIRTELKDEKMHVIGMADVWFSARDRDFFPIRWTRDINRLKLDKFYLVETDYLKSWDQEYPFVIDYLHKNFDCRELKEIDAYGNHPVKIWECRSFGNARPQFVRQAKSDWQTVAKEFLGIASIDTKNCNACLQK